ncbi:hypothetical protein [Enterococcus faecalis]|uniref:hypothetical protein n=1 Tax=Enterococcus faecalis TaxID=1351 RepID=UPI003F8D4D3B
MNKLFEFRGIRIRPFHLNIYRTYLLILWFPFLLVAGGYSYLVLYQLLLEMKETNHFNFFALCVPIGGLFYCS